MDYLKEYRSFVNSHYLTGGIRMTVGILLPALLFGYYDKLPIGMAISLGALAVSITDNPGPIRHRRNGLIVCAAIVFSVAIITSYTLTQVWLYPIWLLLGSFLF